MAFRVASLSLLALIGAGLCAPAAAQTPYPSTAYEPARYSQTRYPGTDAFDADPVEWGGPAFANGI